VKEEVLSFLNRRRREGPGGEKILRQRHEPVSVNAACLIGLPRVDLEVRRGFSRSVP